MTRTIAKRPEREGAGDSEDEPRSPVRGTGKTRGQPGFLQRLVRPVQAAIGRDHPRGSAGCAGRHGEWDQTISPGERAMLHNILRLREVRVEDVMIPRADVEAVDQKTTLGDLLKMFEESGHSRMPVYDETLDDPRGMVHIRDVLPRLPSWPGRSARAAKNAAAPPVGHNRPGARSVARSSSTRRSRN
jgi:hypothetical protein